MKKLLSLPPNLVDCFHDITGLSCEEWFCTNDPVGAKLGSGGGTTWLMQEYEKSEYYDNQATGGKAEKRLILMPEVRAVAFLPMLLREKSLLNTCVPLGERTTLVSGFAFASGTFV